jgi:hypothetical protein
MARPFNETNLLSEGVIARRYRAGRRSKRPVSMRLDHPLLLPTQFGALQFEYMAASTLAKEAKQKINN